MPLILFVAVPGIDFTDGKGLGFVLELFLFLFLNYKHCIMRHVLFVFFVLLLLNLLQTVFVDSKFVLNQLVQLLKVLLVIRHVFESSFHVVFGELLRLLFVLCKLFLRELQVLLNLSVSSVL